MLREGCHPAFGPDERIVVTADLAVGLGDSHVAVGGGEIAGHDGDQQIGIFGQAGEGRPESGGVFAATRCTVACELSRHTITDHLRLPESTIVVHVGKPFSARRSAEIVRASRVWWFDSGSVRFARGWSRPAEVETGAPWTRP